MAFDSNIKGYMTFGKSFSRGAAFPLEAYEIWTDYDALVAYAANTDPNKDPSYIGQKVAYVDKANNKVTHYGIEIDGTLKELGASPIGDEKSIVIGENNTISLKGIDGLVFERDILGEDGEPTGQKENVQFQPLMTKDGLIWVEPSKTTVEGLASLIDGLTARVSALENDRVTEEELAAAVKVVADKVGVPADGDTSTATLYERIAAEVLRATQAEDALSDRIGVAKDGETAATGVYAYVDGVVNALVNGVDPDKIDSLNELIAWVEAHPDIVSGLDERLGKVEGVLDGFGGEEQPATVKGYIDSNYATKQEIADAGYAVAADIERDYAKKATTLEGYGITDAYTKNQIDEKIGTPGVPAEKDGEGNVTTEAIPGTGVFASTYSKAELNALLDEIEGGSTESAASVARQLDEYKTSNNERVKNIEDKVGKDVNGEEAATGLFLEVDEARKVADEAKTASNKNASDITALQGQLSTTDGNVSGILTRLGALETEVGVEEKSRIDVIEGILNGAGEDEGLVAIVTGHGTKIGLLESADIRIEKKADDNATAILALQNKVDTGDKTVTAYVAEEIGKIKPYDDTAVKALITAEAERATGIEAGLRTDVDANIAAIALLNDEATKEGSVKHTVATELAKIISDDDADIDTLNEIAAWIINDTTGAAKMANDIAALNATVDTGDKKVSEYVAAEIAKVPTYTLPGATVEALGGIKSAVDVDGKVAVNKVYVDADGNAEVKAFSTDNLVQGNMTLVLNGGDAQVAVNA